MTEIKTDIYKGYEIFNDSSYFDMFCIRLVGNTNFLDTMHVSTYEEATQSVDELIVLRDYMDWHKNKYTGTLIITDYLIAQFVQGK